MESDIIEGGGNLVSERRESAITEDGGSVAQ